MTLSAVVAGILLLGGLQVRGWNGVLNADGVSYIELATRYAHGDFTALANGYWSPLYPMLLGGALALAGAPGIYLGEAAITPELRIVSGVNLCVLAAATLLVLRLLLLLDATQPPRVARGVRLLRALAGLALWIWCAIRLIGVTTVTPDMLLAGWLFLVTGELLEASRGAFSRGSAARIGAGLALGFWTKAVFFPLVFVGIAVYLVRTPKSARRAYLPWLLVPALAVTAPLVIVQSVSQGHLSFGETGRLNYRWYVNGRPRGEPQVESTKATQQREAGTPAVVALTTVPGAALYIGDSPGSFPYWHDPTRFEAKHPDSVSTASLWRTVRDNLHWYRVVVGLFTMLCLVATIAALTRQRVRASHGLAMLPSLTLLALYALTHPEGRLAGPALVVALVMLLYSGGASRREAPSFGTVSSVAECAALALLVVIALGRVSNRVPFGRHPTVSSPARDLARLGVRPGARVGVLGTPYGHYWAHQSGVRIAVVREVSPEFPAADMNDLEAMASESCARGAPLAAIVWRGPHEAVANVAAMSGGWSLWKPSGVCALTPHSE